MAPSGTRIIEAEWNRIHPIFQRLYLAEASDDMDEAQTLENVIRILETQYDFPRGATPRMFKTKIRQWNLDKKTIRGNNWEILDHLWQEGDTQGIEREFQWRAQKKRQKKADIKKHFNRVLPEKRFPADLELMQQLIDNGELVVFNTPRAVSASRRNATTRLRQESSPARAVQGAAILNPQRLQPPHDSFDHLAHLHPQRFSPGFQRHTPVHEMRRSLTVTADSTSATPSSTSPQRRAEEGLDTFSDLFHNTLRLDNHTNEEIKASAKACIGLCRSSDVVADWPLVEDAHVAGQWTYCAVIHCVQGDLYAEKSLEHLSHANDLLSLILRRVSACEYVLPGLLWVSGILFAISEEKYGQFLDESVAVIDQGHANSLVYGLPYKYARAVLRQDHREMESLGQMLGQGRDQCRQIFGLKSVSVLVFDYYMVSHWLEIRNYQAALAYLLEHEGGLLRKSEILAGHNDLLTLSCLDLTSRAYLGDDQLNQAILCMEDAVTRSKVKFAEHNAYRLFLLDRLAGLLRHTNRLQETEELLREVLDRRVEILGIYSTFVWGSLDDLQVFLQRHGRHEEAKQKKFELQRLFHEQNLQRQLMSSTARVGEKRDALDFLCQFWAANQQPEKAREVRTYMCAEHPELR